MTRRIQHYATLCLAVFTAGALVLPFAHEFTHIRSLQHTHGAASAEFTQYAAGVGGGAAIDFVVEERTAPHNPNCEICARLALDTPVGAEPAAIIDLVDLPCIRLDVPRADPLSGACPIRAPPYAS